MLVVVSKTRSIESIMEIYNQGHRSFGENRVQELLEKQAVMPKDIKWHMIGHLQKNKVKLIAPFISLIHSIDSLELLKVVDKEAKRNDRIIDVLLQLKIAKEESKYGLSKEALSDLIRAKELENVRIVGMMGMASFTSDQSMVKKEFDLLKRSFDEIKNMENTTNQFKELSMGMSGDYKIAIECGSTMIRVGSLVFNA